MKIRRVSSEEFSVKVDDMTMEYPGSPGRPSSRLDLDGYLYVGGVPRIMYNNLPEQVTTKCFNCGKLDLPLHICLAT